MGLRNASVWSLLGDRGAVQHTFGVVKRWPACRQAPPKPMRRNRRSGDIERHCPAAPPGARHCTNTPCRCR